MKKAETGMSRRNFLLGLGAAGGALAMGAAGCAPKASGGAEAPQGQSGETTVATGTGVGRGGEIAVKVALDGTVITSVSVVKHNENLLISDEALSRIPAEIVRTQTTDVDVVSGATLTSFGLKSAVENALANAGLSRNDLTQVAEPAIPREEPIAADVAIVGGGLAGITAAVRLVEQGKTVALFEESGHLGGCAIAAYGWLLNVDTIMEAEEGTQDSPDQYVAHLEDVAALYGEKLEYPEIARAYAENNGPMVDWLDTELNVDFGARTGGPGIYDPEEVNRIYHFNNYARSAVRTLIDKLHEGVAQGQASVSLEARVTKLLSDESGVHGVEVTYADGTVSEYEFASVILCTGGFCHSQQLQQDFGIYENVGTCNPSTAEGHGIDIALEAGCQMVLADRGASYGGGVNPLGGELRYLANLSAGGQIWVDARGKRLIKEDGTRFSQKAWDDAEHNEMFVVFSEDTLPARPIVNYFSYLEGELSPWQSKAMLDELVEGGQWAFTGETPEELAGAAGIDPAAFAQTIADFNGYCDAGSDPEFGVEDLRKLEGKLYAIKTIPYLLMARGGLRVSPKAEALDESGNPIVGLFVAGEQIGLHQYGGMISNGAGLGGATTWGYIAANTVASL